MSNVAKEIWEDHPSYDAIVQSFGTIICEAHTQDWQGDSLYALKDLAASTYGFLCFGWGSCSGCDALEACNTAEDLQELMDDLLSSIIPFDDKESLCTFLKEHDWEGDFVDTKLGEDFTRETTKILLS